jgi:hypothetical protein
MVARMERNVSCWGLSCTHIHGNALVAWDEVFCVSECRDWEEVALINYGDAEVVTLEAN